MNDNRQKGILHKTAVFLGLAEGVSEERSETIYGPVSAPSHARSQNSTVTPGDALSLVSVYRAVSIISTAIKGMPTQVFRQGVEVLPTPSLVKSPSLVDSRGVVMEETVMSLALSGNAYWLLRRSGPNEPVVAIEVLNPHSVRILINEKDEVTGYQYGEKVLKPWQVKHLALLRVPGSKYGLGPIQAAQSTLRGAHDVRDYSANWFRDSGVPAGILNTEQTITGEQAMAMQDRFVDALGSSRVPVLGNGVNFQPIYLSPSDAQFLETQQFTKTEIATLFGVPALYMLADAGNSQSYSNQQQVDVAFLKYSLAQYLLEIEQALSELLPRGQEARFNTEGLLRTDTKARYESFAIGITNGWLSVNDVRAIEGLEPVANGNEYGPKTPPAPVAPEAGDDSEDV